MPSQAVRLSNPITTCRFLLLVLVPLAVLTLTACGDDPPGVSDFAEERTVVPAEASHVLGTSDSVSRIRDLVPGPDGTVWVLNDASPWFIGFGPDGQVVAAHGGRGDGPDEFQAPVALAAVGTGAEAGSVWAYDRGRHAMRRIDVSVEEGSAAVAFPRDDVAPGRLLSLDDVGFGGSRIWARGTSHGVLAARSSTGESLGARPLWDAELVFLSLTDGPNGPEVATDLDLGERLGDPELQYPGATLLLPFPLWDRCPDGSTVYYDPLENHLVRVGGDEGHAASVALPPAREVGLTLDRLYSIIVPWMLLEIPAHERPPEEELRHALESEFQQVSTEFAEVFPEYAGLQCVSGGRVWLQPYDPEDGVLGYGTEWWRIDPWTEAHEAARVQAVEFPERFTPYRFEDEGVWGVVRDELDVESVAWLELP